MEPVICDYCGAEVEGGGIRHRRRMFCCDECCESYEDELIAHGEPDPEDLADAVDPLDLGDDLGDDLEDDLEEDEDLDDDLGDDDYFDEDDDRL